MVSAELPELDDHGDWMAAQEPSEHHESSGSIANHGGPGASYTSAVHTAKHHLTVCLKLLGIMYRNDDDAHDRQTTKEDQNFAWPGESRGDKLYLAMVMLNSALLKALHVADSFQLHCHREFPKVSSPPQDSPSSDNRSDVESRRLPHEDGKISGEEYRRLQAECFVHLETARSLEQQRDSDKARMRQLEDECRQLKVALAKPTTSIQAQEIKHKPEPAEVAELKEFGVALEWRPEGTVAISDTEMQRLRSAYQGLGHSVQEARVDASVAKQRAEDAGKSAAEAKKEREEFQTLLGAGQENFQSSVRQLVSDLSRARAEQEAHRHRRDNDQSADAVLSQLRDLQAQDLVLEQQCHDLCLENSKLQEIADSHGRATIEAMSQPGSRRGVGNGAALRGLGGAPGPHQKLLGYEFPDADSVAAETESTGSRSQHTGRGHRAGHGRNQKPFVVCSSSRSHHASAHSHHRSRRGAPGTLPEDRIFAKAALRYAKNPSDVQALGKLASLLQKPGGLGHSGDARLAEQSSGVDARQDASHSRADPSAVPVTSGGSWCGVPPAADDLASTGQMESRRMARSPSPNSAARVPRMPTGPEPTAHRMTLHLGKVRGVQSPWPSNPSPARSAWTTPERRA